jgi:hypothetical protein
MQILDCMQFCRHRLRAANQPLIAPVSSFRKTTVTIGSHHGFLAFWNLTFREPSIDRLIDLSAVAARTTGTGHDLVHM